MNHFKPARAYCLITHPKKKKYEWQIFAYLTCSDDEAVLVLVFKVFGVFQFLPADAYCHSTHLIVCPKVV